jgi:hypothetical protein
LNARISNANFAHADLLNEMNNTLKAMAATIAVLQRENAELQAKPKETPKPGRLCNPLLANEH